MMSLSFSSSTSREADRPKDDKAFVQQDQDMATVAVIPHWCDSLIMLHPFYILSFAQMLLPISAAAKGVLWTILFGLAKTCQYGGLTILGVEGYNRVKNWIRRKRES